MDRDCRPFLFGGVSTNVEGPYIPRVRHLEASTGAKGFLFQTGPAASGSLFLRITAE